MKLVQTIGCPRIKNMDVECEVKPAGWNWYRLWCQTLMWIQPRQLVSLRIKTRFYEGNVCEVKRNFAVWWRYPRWFGCREMWVAVSHLCTNTNYHTCYVTPLAKMLSPLQAANPFTYQIARQFVCLCYFTTMIAVFITQHTSRSHSAGSDSTFRQCLFVAFSLFSMFFDVFI